LFKIPFNKEFCATVCLLQLIEDLKDSDIASVLSIDEQEVFLCFKSLEAKISYFLGRYASKLAIRHWDSKIDNIIISNGIFGQPIIENHNIDISITHTKKMAACIAYDRFYVFGIDIESKNENLDRTLQLFDCEEVKFLTNYNESAFVMAWTLKEALSKALKCGITVPLPVLSIKNLIICKKFFVCEFSNFPQYKGLSFLWHEHFVSIAYPSIPEIESAILNSLVFD
jgi:phosphopantetheinyl transferase